MITEDHLEQLALSWFQDAGWRYCYGSDNVSDGTAYNLPTPDQAFGDSDFMSGAQDSPSDVNSGHSGLNSGHSGLSSRHNGPSSGHNESFQEPLVGNGFGALAFPTVPTHPQQAYTSNKDRGDD